MFCSYVRRVFSGRPLHRQEHVKRIIMTITIAIIYRSRCTNKLVNYKRTIIRLFVYATRVGTQGYQQLERLNRTDRVT